MSEPLKNPCQDTPLCPRCRQPGRRISAVTVTAMLDPTINQPLVSTDGFCFCGTQNCDVAYFKPGSDELVLHHAVRVPIFQKSSSPARLVCYCFGHTVEAVQSEVRATGFSKILDDIKTRCAQGLNACERHNPQGFCCVGNVQHLVREAENLAVPSAAGKCGCCHSG